VLTTSKTPVAAIQSGLRSLAGGGLAVLEFVRQYDGPPLLQGQKSVTYHLEIGADDHTVTTEEVAEIRNRIIEGMRQQGYDFRS
jgi:phenylalanyl-tRNA synthetase beta chain